MSKKVNLFLVGAMKAGTTSLVDMLGQFPTICVGTIKEPHHFINHLPYNLYSPSKYFDLQEYFDLEFPEPLHIAHVQDRKYYERIYSKCESYDYRLDASTAYLHAPESCELIHSYNPNAKCIILLRDPIKRAYSHYTMDVGLGRQKDSFESAISKEIVQYNEGSLTWNSYIGMSLYDKAIMRYRKLFGADLLIVQMEELFKNRNEIVNKISAFLDIEPVDVQDIQHKNASRTIRYGYLFYILKKLGMKDLFSRAFGYEFKQKVFLLMSKRKKSSIPLSSTTINTLNEIFKNSK